MAVADMGFSPGQTPRAPFGFSLPERALIASRALVFYAGKLLWPAGLLPIYPRWTIDTGALSQWVPVAVVIAVFLAAGAATRRIGRAPLAVLAFYVVTLSPVLGFVDFPFMGLSFVADRFQYLACLGPIALGAAAVVRASERWPSPPPATRAAAAGVLLTLGVLTWRGGEAYASEDTYYQAVLAGNPSCALAENNLAKSLDRRGQLDDAIPHYEAALRIDPSLAETHNSLAAALANRGRSDEAIREYEEALRLRPAYADAHNNLAIELAAHRRYGEAIAHYQEALKLEPDSAMVHYNFANALVAHGQVDDGIREYRAALRLEPGSALVQQVLADVLARRAKASP
jgi:tetratricopeptide (TPR) repeat protein